MSAALDFLEEHPANMIVLATRRHEGWADRFRRRVAEPLARESKLMTLFVRDGTRGFVDPASGRLSLNTILVPVDRRPEPQPAIDAAGRFLDMLGLKGVACKTVHAGSSGKPPRLKLKWPAGREADWEALAVEGPPVEGILKTAEKVRADLVVMATDGHQGFMDALRGSVTEQVLRAAPCPLLAVPAGS